MRGRDVSEPDVRLPSPVRDGRAERGGVPGEAHRRGRGGLRPLPGVLSGTLRRGGHPRGRGRLRALPGGVRAAAPRGGPRQDPGRGHRAGGIERRGAAGVPDLPPRLLGPDLRAGPGRLRPDLRLLHRARLVQGHRHLHDRRRAHLSGRAHRVHRGISRLRPVRPSPGRRGGVPLPGRGGRERPGAVQRGVDRLGERGASDGLPGLAQRVRQHLRLLHPAGGRRGEAGPDRHRGGHRAHRLGHTAQHPAPVPGHRGDPHGGAAAAGGVHRAALHPKDRRAGARRANLLTHQGRLRGRRHPQKRARARRDRLPVRGRGAHDRRDPGPHRQPGGDAP